MLDLVTIPASWRVPAPLVGTARGDQPRGCWQSKAVARRHARCRPKSAAACQSYRPWRNLHANISDGWPMPEILQLLFSG